MTNKNNYDKLFSRLTMILGRLYNGEELTISEMMEDYNVSRRTLERDYIRLSENFPIEKNGSKWKMEDEHRIGRTNKQSEIIVLEIMENMSKSLGTKIFNKSKSLLTKLKNDEESPFFTKLLFEDISEKFADLELLESCIKKNKIISFIHDAKTKYLQPYKILNLDGYWYICGLNVKTNRLTNIKINKISLLKNTNEIFVRNKDIEEKVKCGITGNFKPSRKLQNVELLINDDPKKILKKIPISPTLKVIDRSDTESWIHVSLQVTDLNEITPFIKKNIPKVFVVSPKKLQNKIKNDVENYLNSNWIKDLE